MSILKFAMSLDSRIEEHFNKKPLLFNNFIEELVQFIKANKPRQLSRYKDSDVAFVYLKWKYFQYIKPTRKESECPQNDKK